MVTVENLELGVWMLIDLRAIRLSPEEYQIFLKRLIEEATARQTAIEELLKNPECHEAK
jgi:hypothetical protein